MTTTPERIDIAPEAPNEETPGDSRRRRRIWRRIVVGMLVLVLLFTGWSAFAAWRLTTSLDHIPATALPSLSAGGNGPTTILLVGNDRRGDVDPDDPDRYTSGNGARADVIMLVHALPGRGVTQLLSIPRDLRVEIPGSGVNRINAAYAFGGPDLLVRTLQRELGIPIHHYAELGFDEFADVVDGLGGVDVSFPNAARDRKVGHLADAGTTHLDGTTALLYARSRQYEELRNGSWVSVDGGDIGRTRRQQVVLAQLLDRATSPARIPSWPGLAADLGGSMTVDDGMTATRLFALGWSFARARSFEATTLPVRGREEGGRSYVVMTDAAPAVLEAFRSGEPLAGS